jgi:hypothetical protein
VSGCAWAIEHLDELDASSEDTSKAKAEARLVQEPTPALRPNTATPALQAVVAEKAESPSDLESLAHLLGDLAVGAGVRRRSDRGSE